MRRGTPGAENWEHNDMGAHISGSARVKFSLDVLGQTRDTVRVLPWARESEAEWQLGRRICSETGRNGRICDLERLKADIAHRVGISFGIF